MGLKPGYKQTEVGAIPDDWKDVPITQVTHEIFLGLTAKVDYVEHGGVPLVRATDIASGRLTFTNARTISTKQHKMLTKYRKVQRGNILVSKSGSLGVCAIVDVDREFSIYESIIVLQPKDELDSKFLLHLLRDEQTQSRMIGDRVGSSVAHLNLENFRNLNIPLPHNKAEQEVIAEALSDADALIESLEQLIAKKRNLKRGAMQELLMEGKRLPGFGGEWNPSLMSDYFEPLMTRNEELNNNVVTISAQQGFVRQEEFFKKRVASNVLTNYYLLERGQFAYNRSYSNGYPFGAVKLLSKFDKAVVTTLYICFRPKPGADVCLTFFEQYFEAGLLNDGLASVANEGGRAHGLLNVTKADFFSRPVKVPDFDEQTAIAAALSDMDAEIAELDAKLDKTRRLKQGMMHNLLTGSIRLV
jgi:type I restriction enzyme, S subunit